MDFFVATGRGDINTLPGASLKYAASNASLSRPPDISGMFAGTESAQASWAACAVFIIADCVQKETTLKKRWGCCAEDETKKLRRGMSDRRSAASGMFEWENNLIPSPLPELF